MDEKWLESLSQLYDNRPDISDDEVFRIIPELNGDRKKLEAAQGYYYMKKNGYTDAKIKSTLPELFPAQAKQPSLNDMKAQMAQKFNTKPVSDSPNPNAQIQTNATATLKEQGDKPFQSVTEKHQQEALAAQKRVQDELLNSNGVVKNIISRSKADQYQAGVRDNLTDIPNAAAQHLQQVDPKVFAPDTKVSDEEVQQYQQNMNPEQEREVLNHVAQQNPEKQKQLEHDMYLLDATARGGDSQKVLKNAEKIKSGDYDYSIWKGGSVQKPEGFFSSLANGFKQRQKLLEDYDTFNNTDNDGAVISQLEADRNQAPPDPDEPVPTPKGLGGTLGGITGSEGIATAKSLGAGALTNLIPGVGEALSPWVAAAASSPEYYKRAYAGTLRQVYNEERDKGMPEFDALQKARSQAKVDAELSAAQGAAMTVAGMKLGMKPTELNLSPGFINTVKGVAKGAGKFLTESAPEAGANAGIAAGLEVGKNLHAQSIGLDRETDQGAADVAGQMLAFHYGLGALTKLGGAAVSGINKKRILTEVAKQPDEVIKQNLGEMVQDGNITPDDATDVQQQVSDMRKLDGMIPDKVVNQEVRIKLQDKMAKRDALEEEMKGLHKSLQKPLKERIAAMDEDIVSLANSDEAKIETNENSKNNEREVQPQQEQGILPKDGQEVAGQTAEGDKINEETKVNDTANAQDGSNNTAGESTDTAGRVPEENVGSADRIDEPLPAGNEQHDQSRGKPANIVNNEGSHKPIEMYTKQQIEENPALAYKEGSRTREAIVNNHRKPVNALLQRVINAKQEFSGKISFLDRNWLTKLKDIFSGTGNTEIDKALNGISDIVTASRATMDDARKVMEESKKFSPEWRAALDRLDKGTFGVNYGKSVEELNEGLANMFLNKVSEMAGYSDDIRNEQERYHNALRGLDTQHKGAVEKALKEGKYDKWINEGRITPENARAVIESMGLKVPKDITSSSDPLKADLHKFLSEDEGLPQVHKDAGVPEPVEVKEQPHEFSKYADTSTVLSEAKEHFKDHPLIQRVIKFLEPILKDNPHIRIDPSKPLDSKYDGMQYPDGSIAINFKNFSNKGDMYRTMLHEMMHGVTRGEIVHNTAFQDELSDVLGKIRENLKLPDNDGIVQALYQKGIIDHDLYGVTNPHELLAEVFTNQKFHDYLKNIKYEGTNLLERLFLKIAKWFSDKYKAIADVKEHTSAEDIAHYLMDLTEHVVKKGKIGTAGPDELAKASGLQVNKAVKWVADKLKAGVDEAQIHSALQSTLQVSPDIATNIIENAKLRPETASIDRNATPSGKTITDEDIQAVLGSKSKISVGSAVMKTLGDILKKNFTSTGGLPELWLSIKEFATGSRKLAARQMKGLILDLHEAVKKTGFTDYKKISEALANEPNVANNPALAALPNELQQVVIGMRNMVDGYSQSLISEGLIEPSKALILEDHLGEYLNRSYQLYTDKNWPDKVPPQVREDAVRFLSQQNLESILEQNPNMPVDVAMKHAIQLADTQVKDYLTLKKTPTGQRYSEQISKDLSALKKREDIPAPIRKLMGEYEDPATQFAVTISKLATLHSQGKMLKTLREQFKGTLFFEKGEARPDGFNHEVSATGSEAWSPLNGLYTSKAVIDELQAQQTQWTPALAWYRKVFGVVKGMKTVYSIPTQAVNFGANPSISIANGHFNFTKLGDAWKYYKDEMFHDGTSQDALIETLVQHNVIGQSLDLRSLRHNLQRDDADIFNIEESIKSPSTMKNPINWVKGLDKLAQKQYGASDSFWKVYGFSNEATDWSNALYDKKYSALNPTEKAHIDQIAAERIKNGYPTYDRALKGLLWAQNNIPGIGNFMAFQAEVLRTTKNNFLYALKDMRDPNPKVKLLGAKRMAGIMTYTGLKASINYAAAAGTAAGVSSLWSAVFGDAPDKQQKRLDLDGIVPDFLATHNLIVEDKGEGLYSVRDLDRLDPYNMMWQAMNAGYTGFKNNGVTGAVAGAGGEVMEPFIEPDMIAAGLLQLHDNLDTRGNPIYNRADPAMQQKEDMMRFMWGVVEPTTLKLTKRMESVYKTDLADSKSHASALKAAGGEFGKSLVGMREFTANATGSFTGKLASADEKLDDNRHFRQRAKYDKVTPMTDEQKQQFDDNARRVFAELHEEYNRSLRLGADKKKLDKEIRSRFMFVRDKASVLNAIIKGSPVEKIDLYEK